MNYELLAETKFAGLTRPQLREACKTLGITISGNEGDESIRAKLCSNFGVVADAPQEAKAIKPQKSNGVPNLSPNGAWGGKFYFVTVRTSIEGCNACPVGWQGLGLNLPIDEEVKIPAPHYRQLLSSENIENATRQEKYTGPDGLTKYRTKTAKKPDFTLHDVHVDPETAHLPESYSEFFRALAVKTGNFASYNQKQLVYVAGILADWMKRSDLEKLSDDAIRDIALRQLGIVIEEEILGLEAA